MDRWNELTPKEKLTQRERRLIEALESIIAKVERDHGKPAFDHSDPIYTNDTGVFVRLGDLRSARNLMEGRTA